MFMLNLSNGKLLVDIKHFASMKLLTVKFVNCSIYQNNLQKNPFGDKSLRTKLPFRF